MYCSGFIGSDGGNVCSISWTKRIEKISKKIHFNTAKLEKKLQDLGLTQLNTHYFDTLRIKIDADKVRTVAEKKEINFLYIDEQTVGISINEITDEVALLKILKVFEEVTLQKI